MRGQHTFPGPQPRQRGLAIGRGGLAQRGDQPQRAGHGERVGGAGAGILRALAADQRQRRCRVRVRVEFEAQRTELTFRPAQPPRGVALEFGVQRRVIGGTAAGQVDDMPDFLGLAGQPARGLPFGQVGDEQRADARLPQQRARVHLHACQRHQPGGVVQFTADPLGQPCRAVPARGELQRQEATQCAALVQHRHAGAAMRRLTRAGEAGGEEGAARIGCRGGHRPPRGTFGLAQRRGWHQFGFHQRATPAMHSLRPAASHRRILRRSMLLCLMAGCAPRAHSHR